jgi:hypothetical protein
MKENSRTSYPGGTESRYSPLAFVIVPRYDPLKTTLTPTRGSPVLLWVTIPDISGGWEKIFGVWKRKIRMRIRQGPALRRGDTENFI